MLRSNLATRPFYNERLVTLVIGAVAMLAIALTIFNVTRVISLSRERGSVRSTIAADHEQADRLAAHAIALQRGIDRDQLVQLAGSTHEANDLIDQRTFSWTTLFALLEKTMPFDVRVISVTPRTEKDVLKVSMVIVARTLDNVWDFVAALSNTGRFYDVRPTEQQPNDNGTYTAVVDASYLTTLPARADTAPSLTAAPDVQAPTTPSKAAAPPPRDAPKAPAARPGGRR